MTYSFALCDDEPAELNHIEMLIRKWAAANNHTASATRFPSAEAFLFQYSEEKTYDILLLDIEMGGMSGVELARRVRAGNKEAQIIFITGYMDYISDGYDVEALHYLLKPVSEEKFFAVLDRAAEKLKSNERALILKLADESVRIPLYEIKYLEVQRNYVTIHAKEIHTVKTTLSELEKKLDSGFFRVGRSFVVNLKYIRKVTKTDIHLSDGALIPLPRGLYDIINRKIISG